MSFLVKNGVGTSRKPTVKVKIKGATIACYIDLLYGTKLDII
jgi:hypothetical protein